MNESIKKICAKAILLTLSLSILWAQEPWTYIGSMDKKFPGIDTLVVPYMCATDNQDNIWVISSSTSAPGAINALYKAAPTDSMFTLMVDYSNDLNVESTRGLTTIDDTVFVVCRQPGTPVPQIAIMYEYPNGDPNAAIAYTTGGYGTWILGLSANKDKYIYAGIAYLTSIRVYDFTDGSANRGKWMPIDPLTAHPSEPGGHNGASLVSKIRDVAVIPGADYSNSMTPFFSSRESDTTGQGGGIAVWTGGTQTTPKDYVGQRVTDVASDLSWLWWTPYGIACDSDGYLYVCGTDTMRRWVKSFLVSGNFAIQSEEFPAKFSKSSPVPEGAPILSPTDIALSADEQSAYVTDMEAHRLFVFHRGAVGIEEMNPNLPQNFVLEQNYPNPFNPKTVINYQLPGQWSDRSAISQVDLSIYNTLGQKIATLVSAKQVAGYYKVEWDASGFPTGIYLYQLRATSKQQCYTQTKKLIYMK